MNRFGKRKNRGFFLKNVLAPSALFLVLFVMLYLGLGSLDAATRSEQLRAAEQAVRRAAVHCYAVEGQYPPNLTYLEEHYGIQTTSENYIIHYQSVGGNLMPDIMIIPLGDVAEDAPE